MKLLLKAIRNFGLYSKKTIAQGNEDFQYFRQSNSFFHCIGTVRRPVSIGSSAE